MCWNKCYTCALARACVPVVNANTHAQSLKIKSVMYGQKEVCKNSDCSWLVVLIEFWKFFRLEPTWNNKNPAHNVAQYKTTTCTHMLQALPFFCWIFDVRSENICHQMCHQNGFFSSTWRSSFKNGSSPNESNKQLTLVIFPSSATRQPLIV